MFGDHVRKITSHRCGPRVHRRALELHSSETLSQDICSAICTHILHLSLATFWLWEARIYTPPNPPPTEIPFWGWGSVWKGVVSHSCRRYPREFLRTNFRANFAGDFIRWIFGACSSLEKKRGYRTPAKNPLQNSNQNLGASQPKSALQGPALDQNSFWVERGGL